MFAAPPCRVPSCSWPVGRAPDRRNTSWDRRSTQESLWHLSTCMGAGASAAPVGISSAAPDPQWHPYEAPQQAGHRDPRPASWSVSWRSAPFGRAPPFTYRGRPQSYTAWPHSEPARDFPESAASALRTAQQPLPTCEDPYAAAPKRCHQHRSD